VPISWDDIPNTTVEDRGIANQPEEAAGAWGFQVEDPLLWVEDRPELFMDEEENRYLLEDEHPPDEEGDAPERIHDDDMTTSFDQSAAELAHEEEFHSANETFNVPEPQVQPAVEAQEPGEGGEG
jgi:hypothetical protein